VTIQAPIEPWYRQFWPWLLILLPATAVVASLWTVRIAFKHADDLVVDDYYRQGLAINQHLEKREAAAALELDAELLVRGQSVSVTLNQPMALADLQLRLFHTMEADRDLAVRLVRTGEQQYAGALPHALSGNWHWQLEPTGTSLWRLNGRLTMGQPAPP